MVRFRGTAFAAISWCALGLLVCLLPRPAAAQNVDDIIKRGKIVFGIDTANPPFGSLGPDGQPQGYEPDVARLVGKYLGVPVEFVTAAPQVRIGYLLTNRVDVIMMGITPERARQVWFTMPYAVEGAVLTGPASLNVKTMADLAGKRIGIPRGAMQDIVLSKSAPKDAQIMRFDDQATAVQALLAGQVDLAGTGMLQYQLLNQEAPGRNFEVKLVLRPLHFGMAVRRGDSDLLQFLNTVVYAIKDNGELEAISETWRHLPVGDLPPL